jgi:hypothetical protein
MFLAACPKFNSGQRTVFAATCTTDNIPSAQNPRASSECFSQPAQNLTASKECFQVHMHASSMFTNPILITILKGKLSTGLLFVGFILCRVVCDSHLCNRNEMQASCNHHLWVRRESEVLTAPTSYVCFVSSPALLGTTKY